MQDAPDCRGQQDRQLLVGAPGENEEGGIEERGWQKTVNQRVKTGAVEIRKALLPLPREDAQV